jgi:uncharacterized protein YdaU (DUF1376 family)
MLIDSYYTNEGPLVADDAKLMRTHCIRTAEEQQAYKNVVGDFFELRDGAYFHGGCEKVLSKIYEKSSKAKESAEKRWASKINGSSPAKCETDANALRTDSEGNANGMLPITHNPITHNPEESGAVAPPVSPAAPKPKRKTKSDGLTLPDYLAQRKAQELPPFDVGNTAEKYIERIGLPPDLFALYWRAFRDKHSEGGASEKTRKLDWAAHLRNGIEGNWYKLWFINGDGKFELTTAGKQAQLAQHRSAA